MALSTRIAADTLKQNYTGTEHLLIALMSDPQVRSNLVAQQISPSKLSSSVWNTCFADHSPEKLAQTEAEMKEFLNPGEIKEDLLEKLKKETGKPAMMVYTPRYKKVMACAGKRADLMHAGEITPLHLLLGFLDFGDPSALKVLESYGCTAETVLQHC